MKLYISNNSLVRGKALEVSDLPIGAIQRKKSYSQKSYTHKVKPSNSDKQSSCYRCGKSPLHDRQHCPARDVSCRKCGKKGHYQSVCRTSTKVDNIHQSGSSNNADAFLGAVHTVISILSYTMLYLVTDHSNISPGQAVWFYNGEDYGHGIHSLYLFLTMIFTALFLLPYTMVCTFSYCFMRFRVINKFKPFIDAYGGPFKDKWRFWFGLRLWITLTLFTVSTILQGASNISSNDHHNIHSHTLIHSKTI